MDIKTLANATASGKVGPREAAYFALLQSERGKQFIALSLEEWKNREYPTKTNFALAYEIASGATRRALTLDYIAAELATKGKIKLRLKEKTLLRIGLYQALFMDRVPIYAIVDETVSIAKRHCHSTFVSFLNAVLRKLQDGVPTLPTDDTPDALSIRYSYPREFVAQLIWDHGLEKTKEILQYGNEQPIVMARKRPGFEMTILDGSADIRQIANNEHYYIQNATPAHLMLKMSQGLTSSPARFLDVCAAPGGKLLVVHDLFPKATVYGNDPSEKRLSVLRKNIEKYRIPAVLTSVSGTAYPTDQQFDLVILDVPCSNSGVLNKRPEARWRLTETYLRPLEQQQAALLKHAARLVKPGGEIWYLTCSVLKRENEEVVKAAAAESSLAIRVQELVLPNQQGWDGGFACALKKQ